MSTKTGVPPVLWMAPAVAKNVNGVVMTSSPGFRSRARSGSRSASVPLAQPMRVPGVREPGDFGLELRDLGPHDEPLALHDGHHGPEDLVLDAVVLGHEVEQRYVHRILPLTLRCGTGASCGTRPGTGEAGRGTGASDSGTLGSRVT